MRVLALGILNASNKPLMLHSLPTAVVYAQGGEGEGEVDIDTETQRSTDLWLERLIMFATDTLLDNVDHVRRYGYIGYLSKEKHARVWGYVSPTRLKLLLVTDDADEWPVANVRVQGMLEHIHYNIAATHSSMCLDPFGLDQLHRACLPVLYEVQDNVPNCSDGRRKSVSITPESDALPVDALPRDVVEGEVSTDASMDREGEGEGEVDDEGSSAEYVSHGEILERQ
ncbi:hypothetical protein KIPB_009479 [Kipferlia bialata]|uniref:Uncharacterized protein n=1 Tax=Kipferlia bialata TaxID=797122 RepID=A0A9K3D3Q8_9EUKA|nr:hypothetical protein KIPB_009479 [Kipferlia bialata]|eukprot:g9479.t1